MGLFSGVTKAVGSIFGGGSEQTGTQTVTNSIDPMLKPYVQFGLDEAKRLYQNPTPYAPFNTVVAPSTSTLQALSGIESRALAGSPLVSSAQGQMQKTIQGDYLSGNPFFQGAFQAATRPLEQQFGQNIMDIRSKLSSSGRYGSGAQSQLEGRASEALATGMSDIAGKLAYENYAAERARQEAAVANAPAMSQADYNDLSKLLAAGTTREGYTQAEIADQLARYQYNMPESRLGTFLSGVYSAPAGSVQERPIYSNQGQQGLSNLLGIAGTAANVYSAFSDIRTKENLNKIGYLPNGLDVYEFEYKDEFKNHPLAGKGKFIGVLAQDAIKVNPSAVNIDDSGYMTVDYSKII